MKQTLKNTESLSTPSLSKLEERAVKSKTYHYQMRPNVGISIVDAKLSPTAYRLWIYLCSLFPFGNVSAAMPSQAELAIRLGVDPRSIRRALVELEECGFWRFKVDRWRGENLTGHGMEPEDKKIAEGTKRSPKGQKDLQKDKNVLFESPEPLQDKASSDPLDLYRSDLDLEKKERETRACEAEPETEQFELEDHPLRVQDAEVPSVPLQRIGEDQFSAPPLTAENFENFDFERFESSSNPDFWHWALQKIEGMKIARAAAKHREPIDNVAAFTFACIKNRGAAGFKTYLISIGALPDEAKAAAAAAESTAKPRSAPDAWQKSHRNLQTIFEQSGISGVIQTLNLLLSGSNVPPDPDRVVWLIDQNPHWRLRLRNGRIEEIDRADISDCNAQIQALIRQLELTKENLEILLEERYGKTRRSQLSEEELIDFARFLQNFGG